MPCGVLSKGFVLEGRVGGVYDGKSTNSAPTPVLGQFVAFSVTKEFCSLLSKFCQGRGAKTLISEGDSHHLRNQVTPSAPSSTVSEKRALSCKKATTRGHVT